MKTYTTSANWQDRYKGPNAYCKPKLIEHGSIGLAEELEELKKQLTALQKTAAYKAGYVGDGLEKTAADAFNKLPSLEKDEFGNSQFPDIKGSSPQKQTGSIRDSLMNKYYDKPGKSPNLFDRNQAQYAPKLPTTTTSALDSRRLPKALDPQKQYLGKIAKTLTNKAGQVYTPKPNPKPTWVDTDTYINPNKQVFKFKKTPKNVPEGTPEAKPAKAPDKPPTKAPAKKNTLWENIQRIKNYNNYLKTQQNTVPTSVRG